MRISDWSSDVCSSDLVITLSQPISRHPSNSYGNGSFEEMKKLIKVGSAMALLAPGIAVAQTADQSGGELIVTAQKRETRIVAVSAAITVVDGEPLTDTGVATIQDAPSHVAALSTTSNFGGVATQSI